MTEKYYIPIEKPETCKLCFFKFWCHFCTIDSPFTPQDCPIIPLPDTEKQQAVIDAARWAAGTCKACVLDCRGCWFGGIKDALAELEAKP
jgi:hypothetical protein